MKMTVAAADDVLGGDNLLASGSAFFRDPAARALINDLVERILAELPGRYPPYLLRFEIC
jgi:hypothetical protein